MTKEQGAAHEKDAEEGNGIKKWSEALSRLDQVLAQTGVYAWIIDIEKRSARWLNRWEKTSKFDFDFNYIENIEEAARKRGRIHPDDLDKFQKMFQKLWDGQTQVKEEIRQRIKDRKLYSTYEYCGTVIEWKDGKATLALGTVRDISAQKSMETTYMESMQSINALKRDIISSGRINVSKREIEELFIEGNHANQKPIPLCSEGFREEMKEVFSEIQLSEEQKYILSADGMEQAFSKGVHIVSECYWAKMRSTGQSIWVETKYTLLERHDTGDLIAFFYNQDLTKDKLYSGLKNHLTMHSFERAAAIFVRERTIRPIVELSAFYGLSWRQSEYDQGVKTFCEEELSGENTEERYQEMRLDTVVDKLTERENYTVEYNICDQQGVERRKQVNFSYIDRNYGVILATRTDIALYDRLHYYARHDILTGLYNRETFLEAAKKMIDADPEHTYVFIHVDIEQFKLFNSAFGNEEGNRLLQLTADLLKQTVGSYERTAYGRMQSDVFGFCALYDREILLKNLEFVNRGIRDFKTDYMIRLVFGIFVIENGNHYSLEEASTKAAIAAKKCKNDVNKNYSIYDDKEDEQQRREMRITHIMHAALKEKQFKVFLQPKYDLKTGEPCGAEALVRWLDPKEGLVSPALFIPIFERNGFIANLDQYMWEEVCILLRKWIDAGYDPIPVSVNISRISLYNPNLVKIMERLIQKYDLRPELLHLEITESAYMSNQAMMRETIDEFHKAGFVILMDDFGSGYSSLNTLKDFHIDILKIDMKFLPENTNIKRAEIILACMIHMAKWLGMRVIMEGVETEEQNTFLKGAGCDCIQGYYYARPMPVSDYEENYVYTKVHVEKERTAAELERLPEILVIEDDMMQQDIIQKILGHDYKLSVFDAAEPAMAYLQQNRESIRLIISDNYLSGMNGIDLFEFCMQDEELAKIQKILITVDRTEESRIAAIEHGADEYLVKPLSAHSLVAYVQKWMRISEGLSCRSVCNALDYINEATVIFMYYANTAYLEHVNQSFLKMMGYTTEELEGETYENLMQRLIHPDDRGVIREMVQSIPQEGVYNAVCRVLNAKTGQYVWLQIKGRLLKDIYGTKVCLTFSDVTVQQELLEKAGLLAEFRAAWNSHDGEA